MSGTNLPHYTPGSTYLKTTQLIDQAHGHVIPRPDGKRAPCAGPTGCWTCHLEMITYEVQGKVAVVEAIKMVPGDKILLIAPAALPPGEGEKLKARFEAIFPGVEFAIAAGFTGVQHAQGS